MKVTPLNRYCARRRGETEAPLDFLDNSFVIRSSSELQTGWGRRWVTALSFVEPFSGAKLGKIPKTIRMKKGNAVWQKQEVSTSIKRKSRYSCGCIIDQIVTKYRNEMLMSSIDIFYPRRASFETNTIWFNIIWMFVVEHGKMHLSWLKQCQYDDSNVLTFCTGPVLHAAGPWAHWGVWGPLSGSLTNSF